MQSLVQKKVHLSETQTQTMKTDSILIMLSVLMGGREVGGREGGRDVDSYAQ